MKILLIGSGGREHALAWRIAYSDLCDTLYCAPGNAGIAELAQCVDIAAEDIDGLVTFAKEKEIDFVVVGPEAPLVAGIVDRLQSENIKVFGPTAAAARIEGSKGFMKDLCMKYKIPTANYGRFKTLSDAKSFIRDQGAPVVVKADGLAAGKGVIICQTVNEAEKAAEDMLSGSSFGDAGKEIVIEEFMEGQEVSFFALCDGKTVLPLTSAQDHKQVGEGDTGPNTGGMGAYSPAHIVNQDLYHRIIEKIIKPTSEAMIAEGCPFSGVLFAGLMIVKGEPKVIEFNARFGDPECQTLMTRLGDDLLDLLLATAEGRLDSLDKLNWSPNTSLCVVMAAKGYPGSYQKGTPIKNLDEADTIESVKIFHAGTARNDAGDLVSNGGRVLGVVASGENVAKAQEIAYQAVDTIDWPEGFCRRDIGWHAVKAMKDRVA